MVLGMTHTPATAATHTAAQLREHYEVHLQRVVTLRFLVASDQTRRPELDRERAECFRLSDEIEVATAAETGACPSCLRTPHLPWCEVAASAR